MTRSCNLPIFDYGLPMFKFGEDLLIYKLLSYHNYLQKQVSLPRFTPHGWWECDLAMVSQAGYLSEFEVKVSKADYYADFNKSQTIRYPRSEVRKHDLIPEGKGPKFFWFVMPWEMVPVEEVPDYAGLIYVEQFKRDERMPVELRIRTIRNAPKLPAKKMMQMEINRMFQSAYYRFLNQYVDQQRKRLQEMQDGTRHT